MVYRGVSMSVWGLALCRGRILGFVDDGSRW